MSKDFIAKEFRDLFKFRNKAEEIRHDAFIISARFLSEVERICDERKITRTKLAKKVGTSKSYLTQVFRGDKVLNMVLAAKFQKALKIKFIVSINPSPISS